MRPGGRAGGPGREGRSARWVDPLLCERCEVWDWFESGVTGPLVLGVQLYQTGQTVTLLPDAQRPAGF
jgi:hypothetical protein